MQLSLSFFLALAAVPTAVLGASGFAGSCWDIHIEGGGSDLKLGATCRNIGGGDNGRRVIPLNSCLTNANGALQCKTFGNAMQSCNGCSLAGTFLTCTCSRLNGGTNVANINLNNCVGNNDGRLEC
ncbi:Cyanovirin-N [Auricularia subglabra TFB-10046 SS5]|nr:Cyanovirin-N [Auricularia subglabra TFB-10046 SS5]